MRLMRSEQTICGEVWREWMHKTLDFYAVYNNLSEWWMK